MVSLAKSLWFQETSKSETISIYINLAVWRTKIISIYIKLALRRAKIISIYIKFAVWGAKIISIYIKLAFWRPNISIYIKLILWIYFQFPNYSQVRSSLALSALFSVIWRCTAAMSRKPRIASLDGRLRLTSSQNSTSGMF